MLAAGGAGGAWAMASAWDRSETTAVRLISAQRAVDGTGVASLGLHFRLAPGWKIYWRSPGDAGLPPRIDWAGSTNLAEADIAWPAPERFREFGDLFTHGYKGEVVLPITARASQPGRPLNLRAAVDYLACEEVCVPFSVKLALDVPAGPAAPTGTAALVAKFLARVPGPPQAGGPVIDSVEAAGAGAGRVLRVVARSATPFSAPRVFVEGPEPLYFGRPETELSEGGRRAVFRLPAPVGRDGAALAGARLTVTLADGERAIEQSLVAVAGASEGPRYGALAVILALAFAGGLILNLMPCVLPVLSIKLMGVVGFGGAARRRVTTRFLAAAAGIVAAFLALAAGLAGLKAAGHAVGWGIQFQEPLFLVALVVVLTLFACNMWGLFEVRLPARLGGLGAAGGTRDSIAGHFASGAFATVLATPCSAPFLGTAVGFALAREWPEIFAVFAALGLGMATPYLAVAGFPGVATRLPRPGPWMATLRRILGVLLAATAVWLITVLAAHAGVAAALAVGVAMAAAAAILLIAGGDGWRRITKGGALAAVVVAAFLAPGQLGGVGGPAAPAPAAETFWRPFDRAAIPRLIAAGKTGFVDVTAAWCVTCQCNKTTVLERGDVARRLAGEQVVAMRADWTRPDSAIAAYLEEFGRFGIPFNAVYGPALPRGLALPELLTEKAVLTALDRSGSAVAAAE